MNAVTNDTACVDKLKLVRMMGSSLLDMDLEDASIEADKILDTETVFFWIVEGVMSEENEEHDHYGSLFYCIITRLDTSGRVTLIVRYFNILKKIICNIFTRDVKIYHVAFPRTDYDSAPCITLNACNLVVKVLRSVLDSPKLLEQLLGFDLRVAKHLSLMPRLFDSQADVFREILVKYHEFKKSFRERTERGLDGNPVANLSRSFPPKAPTEGKWYILKEEEE
ncbi:hypothetical protein PRIPAC_72906 [Pristionchus pacificus]|uniref:Uncharacterized protein n=1 Tax=Pristionchus pacificus TaxID=54126 RepID=A0A2A6CRM9_PRIPA|nr:hypothetical protein PRIPAC_72906 [Pristionchus pacificus]|eukprot:PDM80874.1 hypothetical protein PRIPAC_35877 [Pristionchus pacificus]